MLNEGRLLSEGVGVTVNAGWVVETLGLPGRTEAGGCRRNAPSSGAFLTWWWVVENDEELRRDVLGASPASGREQRSWTGSDGTCAPPAFQWTWALLSTEAQ